MNEEPIRGRLERCVVRVPDHVSWSDVDADLVVFNQQDGTYHALDRVASDIWRALARRGNCGAAFAELHERYPDAAAAVIADDLRGFVDRAARLGLLVAWDA